MTLCSENNFSLSVRKCFFFLCSHGGRVLIIPQCLCRLICMWLISVWRSCLWSAGRNPDSSVLHNLRDVLEIEFPSPATHEKSVCHTVSPSPISNTSILIKNSWRSRACVYIFCAFELRRGRMYTAAYFSVHFHIFLSVCWVFLRAALLIGLFTDTNIRITKMAEFCSSNRFNHSNPFISIFFKTLFSPTLTADGLKGRFVYLLSPRWLMPQLH